MSTSISSYRNSKNEKSNYSIKHGANASDLYVFNKNKGSDNQISNGGRTRPVDKANLSDFNEVLECKCCGSTDLDEDEGEEENDDGNIYNNKHNPCHHHYSHNHIHKHSHNNEETNNKVKDRNVDDEEEEEEEEEDNYNNIEEVINDNHEQIYKTTNSNAVRKEHNTRRSGVR